jgi:hypothetical protein
MDARNVFSPVGIKAISPDKANAQTAIAIATSVKLKARCVAVENVDLGRSAESAMTNKTSVAFIEVTKRIQSRYIMTIFK